MNKGLLVSDKSPKHNILTFQCITTTILDTFMYLNKISQNLNINILACPILEYDVTRYKYVNIACKPQSNYWYNKTIRKGRNCANSVSLVCNSPFVETTLNIYTKEKQAANVILFLIVCCRLYESTRFHELIFAVTHK